MEEFLVATTKEYLDSIIIAASKLRAYEDIMIDEDALDALKKVDDDLWNLVDHYED